jgi:HAD superfamily hydrolase (TIGR01509 family)
MGSAGKVVVFDLGNVLITWDRRLLFSQLIPDPDALDWFLENVYDMASNKDLDRGVALADVVERQALAFPEHRATVEALNTRWKETLGGAIDGTVEILRELVADGVRCIALSNWSAETFAQIEDEYDFLALFEAKVISGREGVIKPDAQIFRIMCERHGFEPEQAVFIDDSGANIAAALSLGFDALLFDNPERLRAQLVERNLL